MGIKVSYLIICYNRAEDVAVCITSILGQDFPNKEIIVVDNASVDNTAAHLQDQFGTVPELKYYQMSENYGVSGGRNIALQKATGDILITIDDDAAFIDPTTTSEIVEKLQNNPDIGALAFKIIDHDTLEVQRIYFPSKDKSRSTDEEFETTWIIGAGHAITKQVYKDVGYYRDYRPYGSEEFDLSLRILDAGYRIFYFPTACVKHKLAPTGRIQNATQLNALRLKHRLKSAFLNLPITSTVTFFVVRSGQTMATSNMNPLPILLAWWWLWRERRTIVIQRSPVRIETRKRLRALKGPYYF